ncbi:FBP domain-containing protein [Streptomyces litchfieldiae]|uniref:FBP domain-containing protein n=1 Tax=Streptomyces litchfieldiae TaxID=3075543 RepID=A0ABU2MQP3_9ACTN|nr:FBP domain-containing protein [Streptomyces sp. DSM 44938]MDT0343939.1 FBP domain-containing protein [Streptomyces sp. DSM 44938]
MEPITTQDIRRSLVNMSRRRAQALVIPRLDDVAWQDLDFLAWADGRDANRSYLVTNWRDRLVGMEMRATARGPDFRRKTMCALCVTTHPLGGTALFAARKAGKEGRRGNTVGEYLCRNLACSLYARRKLDPPMIQMHETLSLDRRIDRVAENLSALVGKVLGEEEQD